MTNLKTDYLGITLKNPIVVSSSGLTDSVSKIVRLEELGASAVVLKSLFEEQINYEAGTMYQNGIYPEANDYIIKYSKTHSVEAYLKLIEGAKRQSGIPVIASINCISSSGWVSFAKEIEAAGADALELNIFFVAQDKDKTAVDYESIYTDIITRVKEIIQIPIAVKIGYYFTNLVAIVNKLYYRGAKGVVMFNRFYQPDIDIEQLETTQQLRLSDSSELLLRLRWLAILSGRLDLSLGAAKELDPRRGRL